MATEGERWTAEALDALRAGGFGVRAWRTFLAASMERSRSARRQRPALARQAARWGATGAAAWLLACGLARGRDGVRLRPLAGLAWWAAVWRMFDWHLGMAEDAGGRASERLRGADALTLTRLWLVPALPGVAHSRTGLPGVIVLGALTDFADGRLARAHGSTRLGRDLDTTADLAFVSVAGVAAVRAGRLSAVGAGALGARHAIGLSVSLHAYFGRGRRPAMPAQRWGGALRTAGLALSTAGRPRAGTALLVAGSLAPPRRSLEPV